MSTLDCNGAVGELDKEVAEHLAAEVSEVKVRRDPECPICSRDPDEISDEELGVFPDYEAFCAGVH